MSVSIKDTKNVIFAAYQELAKQARNLETQLKNKERELSQAAKTPARETVRTETKVVVKAPELDNIEGIVSALQSVQEGMNKALSSLTAEQTVQAEELDHLLNQIQTEKKAIQERYQIQITDNTLAELCENYLKEQESFQQTYQELQVQLQQTHQTQTQAWEQELKEHQTQTQTQKDENRKARDREAEAYQYELKQQRKLQDDAYAQKRKQLQEELEELKNQHEKNLAQKETEVAEQEKTFAEYKTKFEGLEERLQKELKKAEAEAKGIVEKDHRVKLNLYKKSVHNQEQAAKHRITALQELQTKQEQQLKKLNEQLIAAYQQAQHLALKALEGSANNDSLQAIREIAMEQAKNSNKSK